MVDRDIIKEWMTKADEDFEFARINLEEEKQFFAQICFQVNQFATNIRLQSMIRSSRREDYTIRATSDQTGFLLVT